MSVKREQAPPTARVVGHVRRLRRERHLSAQQLADRLAGGPSPMSRSVLANLENGRRVDVSVDELFAFGEAFGLPPADLLAARACCARCGDTPPPGFSCLLCGAHDGQVAP